MRATRVAGLAVLSYRQQMKTYRQQQLEAQQQLHTGAAQGVSSGKSSSDKSSSHRDERSEAVREQEEVEGPTRQRGNEGLGRGTRRQERATGTRVIRVELMIPQVPPASRPASRLGGSSSEGESTPRGSAADVVAPEPAVPSVTAPAAPDAAAGADAAAPADSNTTSAAGGASAANADSMHAVCNNNVGLGDDDDDPRLSL